MASLWLLHFYLFSSLSLTALATPIVTVPGTNIIYHGTAANNVESFLNIPFGASTAGANRFASPKPYIPPPNTTINATIPGPACPQRADPLPSFALFSNVTNMSEDCLNLRIDRPATTSPNDKLPVMVWIYGGGAAIGQIYDQVYVPTGLILNAVAHGTPVIYAAMNYRINMFGYSVSQALREEGSLNAGLLDQRLGLEWIKANIAHFGGDPDNITIFGESEGGTDVGLHMTSYGGKGTVPFNKAIMQSGSPTSDDGLTSNNTAQNFIAVANAVNCTYGDPNSAKTLSCLRALPMEVLLAAVITVELAFNPLGFGAFIPTIDGAFIPAPPSTLVREGRFHRHIPTIAGWNTDDRSIFVPPPTELNSTEAFLLSSLPGLSNCTITHLLELYPRSDFASEWERASRLARDIQYTCPVVGFSQWLSRYGGKSWLYQLNQTVFESLLEKIGESWLGVIHLSDIPYAFASVEGYLGNDTTDPLVSSNIELGEKVSGSWAKFASTGEPAGEGVLEGWPGAWCDSGPVVRVIGGPGDGVVVMKELGERCQFINRPGVMAELMT